LNLKKLTFSFLLVFSVFPSSSGLNEWELRKNKHGIKVFSREVKNWRFKELKAVMIVDFPIKMVVDQLRAIEDYPGWVYSCDESQIISESKNKIVYYLNFDAPWPVKDRDIVIESEIEEFKSIVKLKGEGTHTYLAETGGSVRIPYFHSEYTIRIIDQNTTEINYQVKLDPGGWLPSWIVNLASNQGPYLSFYNLKKKLQREGVDK